MDEVREGFCLCQLSRWSVQWREGKLYKGFKSQPWYLMFIDTGGDVWFLDGEYSFVMKDTKVPVGKILQVNTCKI